MYKKTIFITVLISSLIWNTALCQTDSLKIPKLQKEDVEVLSEAYNLLMTQGNKVWPGWSETSIPFIYKKEKFEYWINFPDTYAEGKFVGELGNMKIYGKASIGKVVAAGKDVNDIHTVFIASPDLLGVSKEQWVITAMHEMFHVYQYSKGYLEKVNNLNLAYGDDATWMLQYPFPYQDTSIKTITHIIGYLSYKINKSDSFEENMYDCFILKDVIDLYKEQLNREYGNDDHYWYSTFQQTTEGVAKYTELIMAEIAATDYTPLNPSFHFKDTYTSQFNVVRHSGKGTDGRLTFYYLGLGKCLVLDKINPNWKVDYFNNYWLDEIFANSLNRILKEMEE